MLKAYYIALCDPTYQYVPLRPTGRWKLKANPNNGGGELSVYLEHKNLLIFKRWIAEEDITFLPDAETTINKCQTR